jgi:ubiquinone/menaquinone biosynthesis C-methylase UbiE
MTGSKPSGVLGRFLYAHPWGHYGGFKMVLDRLRLNKDDAYLEVAQGGGVLLSWALQAVRTGAAVDHSPDMVKLATERNRAAVDAGRLEIVQGDAGELPWADETFTAVACAEAFFFFPDPDRVLREMHRVLKPGGRVVIATMAKNAGSRVLSMLLSLFLSEMRLYTQEELASMLREAGFEDVTVSEPRRYHQIGYGKKQPLRK